MGLRGALDPRGAVLWVLGRAGGAEPGAAVAITDAGASCRCPLERSSPAGLILGIIIMARGEEPEKQRQRKKKKEKEAENARSWRAL